MFSIKSIEISRKYFKKKILEYIVTPHFFVNIYFLTVGISIFFYRDPTDNYYLDWELLLQKVIIIIQFCAVSDSFLFICRSMSLNIYISVILLDKFMQKKFGTN